MALTEAVTLGSLYAGIGGLELGLLASFHEAGIPAQVLWQVERDRFCQAVLQQNFPTATRFSDVASVSFPPRVDVLAGGFACQDVSGAGRGAGMGTETRSGFTFLHLLRIVDEAHPACVVVENVASGAKRWLPRVVRELEDRGYRPFAVSLSAADVGAPHIRRRVFVLAYSSRTRPPWCDELRALSDHRDGGPPRQAEPLLGRRGDGLPYDVASHRWPALSGRLPHAWEPARALAKGERTPHRSAQVKALGNAVVPQCGLVVGRILLAMARDSTSA